MKNPLTRHNTLHSRLVYSLHAAVHEKRKEKGGNEYFRSETPLARRPYYLYCGHRKKNVVVWRGVAWPWPLMWIWWNNNLCCSLHSASSKQQQVERLEGVSSSSDCRSPSSVYHRGKTMRKDASDDNDDDCGGVNGSARCRWNAPLPAAAAAVADTKSKERISRDCCSKKKRVDSWSHHDNPGHHRRSLVIRSSSSTGHDPLSQEEESRWYIMRLPPSFPLLIMMMMMMMMEAIILFEKGEGGKRQQTDIE